MELNRNSENIALVFLHGTFYSQENNLANIKYQKICSLDYFQTYISYRKCFLSHCIRKPTKCLGKNKGADQLCSNRETDHRLCFHYMDSTIPLLLKYKISRL